MKVLFVCTGNTCRSPMAEAIFNKLALDTEHMASSCGTNVFMPQNISKKSVEALKNFGISDFSKKSKMITEADIDTADIVLTMTTSHKQMLKTVYTKHKSKIYTLNEKAHGIDSDISDPYGLSQDEYNKCAKQIFDAVEKIICSL